ncbi:MAG: PDZ domain-containing protein [Candidatus Eisenbacteria bacterium]
MIRMRMKAGLARVARGAAVLLLAEAGMTAADAAVLECEKGLPPVGNLGISDLEGSFSYYRGAAGAGGYIRFWSEPRVLRLDAAGPSAEKVRAGDVLFSVGGKLITTEEGSRLFCDPPVNRDVLLGLRRGDVETRVSVTPEPVCPEDEKGILGRLSGLPPAAEIDPPWIPPIPPIPSIPSFPSILSAPQIAFWTMPKLPHPWLGFGLKCSIEGKWFSNNLRFTEPPVVFNVRSGSAADRAGIRAGDVLTYVDGLPIDKKKGTRRFAEIRPGDKVMLTLRRKGEPLDLELRADAGPHAVPDLDAEAERLAGPGPAVGDLRYVGTLGSTAVEVRSGGPVIVEMDEEDGEIVIRTGDSVVRLHATDGGKGGEAR